MKIEIKKKKQKKKKKKKAGEEVKVFFQDIPCAANINFWHSIHIQRTATSCLP